MPERSQGSGQCDSVTGGPLSQEYSDGASSHNEAQSSATTSSASCLPRPTTDALHRVQYEQRSIERNTVLMPPSPPSSPDLSTTTSLSLPDEYNNIHPPALHASHTLANLSHHRKEVGDAFGRISASHYPDTPVATPSSNGALKDVKVEQGCYDDLRSYVQGIFPDLLPIGAYGQQCRSGGRYLLEDAVMELVDAQWSGVVLIDTKSSYSISSERQQPAPLSDSLPDNCGSFGSTSSHLSTASRCLGLHKPRRTLVSVIDYVRPTAQDMRMRVLLVLDHAIEVLHVDNIIFAIDRTKMDADEFRSTVHGLCYVGASIIGRSSTSSQMNSIRDGSELDEECVHSPRKVSSQFVLLCMRL